MHNRALIVRAVTELFVGAELSIDVAMEVAGPSERHRDREELQTRRESQLSP